MLYAISIAVIFTTERQTNSVGWVRERTVPTEPPPLDGEVNINFCGYRVPRGQREGSLPPCSRFSKPVSLQLFFLLQILTISLKRLVSGHVFNLKLLKLSNWVTHLMNALVRKAIVSTLSRTKTIQISPFYSYLHWEFSDRAYQKFKIVTWCLNRQVSNSLGRVWLRVGTTGRLFWTRDSTFGFHKMLGSS
jgi:hypothetical protein